MATYNPQQTFTYANNAYGSNVSPINMPNPSADLSAQLPGLSGLNSQLSGVIGSELSGSISPGTMGLLNNAAAARGVSLGQPNSPISGQIGLNLLGTTSEAQQQAGVNNYNSTIPTVSGTQTVSPALQTEVNTQNAVSAAAPNPTDAANQELSLLNQYMAELQNPAGGTRSFSSTPYPQSSQLQPLNTFGTSTGTGGGYDGPSVGSYDPYSVFSTYGNSPSQPVTFE